MYFTIYFRENISKSTVVNEISRVFNIPIDHFINPEDIMTTKKSNVIPLSFYEFTRGFMCSIDFSIADSKVEVSPIKSEKELAYYLAKKFGMSVLIDAKEKNPYKWILITEDQKEYIVHQINITEEDENEVEVRMPF